MTAYVTLNKAPSPIETKNQMDDQTSIHEDDDEMEGNDSKMTTQSEVNDEWDTNFAESQEDFDAIMIDADSKKRMAPVDTVKTSAPKK